jgi:hypothetical protein
MTSNIEEDDILTLIEMMENQKLGDDVEPVDAFTLGDADLLETLKDEDLLELKEEEVKALEETLGWDSDEGDQVTYTHEQKSIDEKEEDIETLSIGGITNNLRFVVGDSVEILDSSKKWRAGKISSLNFRDSFWPEDQFVPYEVILNDGELMYAPLDDDRLVRVPVTKGKDDKVRDEKDDGKGVNDDNDNDAKVEQEVDDDKKDFKEKDGITEIDVSELEDEELKSDHGNSYDDFSPGGNIVDENDIGFNESGLFTQEEVDALIGQLEHSTMSSNNCSAHPTVCSPCNDNHHSHSSSSGHGCSLKTLRPRMIDPNEDSGLTNINQLNAMMEMVHDAMVAGGQVDQTSPAFRDPKTGSVHVTMLDVNQKKYVVEIKLTDRPSDEFAKISKELQQRDVGATLDDDDNDENILTTNDDECAIM